MPLANLEYNLIQELGSTNKRFLLMGDCYYRLLHWPPTDNDSNSIREAAEFCECLDENFFTQHVEACTRNDAILDLVITDEPDMVHDLVNLGPFPGSDHNVLLWSLEVKTVHKLVDREILDYSKADVEAIKRELHEVNWQTFFHESNTEQCRVDLKKRLRILSGNTYQLRDDSAGEINRFG